MMLRTLKVNQSLARLSVRSFQSSAVLAAKPVKAKGKNERKPTKGGSLSFKRAGGPTTKSNKGGAAHDFRTTVSYAGNFRKTAVPSPITETLNVETLVDGKILNYPSSSLKTLYHLGGFKTNQFNECFSEPFSLVTNNTIKLNEQFVSHLDKKTSNENRVYLLGHTGMGKTTLIAQTQSLAKTSHDVINLSISHPAKLVDGTSVYQYNEKLGFYQQQKFTQVWMKKLLKANAEQFKQIPLSEDYLGTKGANGSLYDFVVAKKNDFGNSDAFQIFIKELQAQDKIPVLFSFDGFNVITHKSPTEYRHADFSPIHFKEFEIGQFILNVIEGKTSFKKGGLLFSNMGNYAVNDSINVGLGLQTPNPYAKPNDCDWEFANKLNNFAAIQLEEFSKENVKSLIQYLKQVNVLRNDKIQTEEELEKEIGEKYFLSGNGNPKQLMKACVMLYN